MGRCEGYRRRGAAAWGYGSHPVNVLASALVRMKQRPRFVGGLAYFSGWLGACLQWRPAGRAGDPPPSPARAAAADAGSGFARWCAVTAVVTETRATTVEPKPRVLMVFENEPYPHDRRVCQEAVALTAAGYEVTVVSRNAVNAPALEEIVDGVRVLRFEAPPDADGAGAVGYAREYLVAGDPDPADHAAVAGREPQSAHGEFDAVIVCNPPDFLIHLVRSFGRRGAGLIFDYHDPSPELFEAMFERRGIIHGADRARAMGRAKGRRGNDGERAVRRPRAQPRRGARATVCTSLVTCPDTGVALPGASRVRSCVRQGASGSVDRPDVAQGEPVASDRHRRRAGEQAGPHERCLCDRWSRRSARCAAGRHRPARPG